MIKLFSIIAALHIVMILVFLFIFRGDKSAELKTRPKGISVELVSAASIEAAAPAPAPPAPPTPPEPQKQATPKKKKPVIKKKVIKKKSKPKAQKRPKPRTVVQKPVKKSVSRKTQNNAARNALLQDLEGQLAKGPEGDPDSELNRQDYYQKLLAYLKRHWQEPTASEVPISKTVKISLKIRRDGWLLSASMMRPSGNRAMDQSVASLLRRVKKVPPFPDKITQNQLQVSINLTLDR